MRAKEIHEAYIHMTATAHHYNRRYSYGYREEVPIPDAMNLGGIGLKVVKRILWVMQKFSSSLKKVYRFIL